MFDDPNSSTELFEGDEAFDMLEELASNTPEEVRRQRAHFRLAVKASVTLQPGNASALRKLKVKGLTVDISEGGCSAVFPVPIRVGDVFRLQFDAATLELPLTFARCVRCRLIREDAFEAGFSFFTPICLPDSVAAGEESRLIS